jgi:predicted nucleic acid-binding Zn ribbon protein
MPRSTVMAQRQHRSRMSGSGIFDNRFKTKKQESRACLQCDKDHDNTNGFCSAECNEIYQKEHPVQRVKKPKKLSRKNRTKRRSR